MTFRRPCFPLLAGVAIRFRMFFCCGFCDSVPGGREVYVLGRMRFFASSSAIALNDKRCRFPVTHVSLFLRRGVAALPAPGFFAPVLRLSAGCRASNRRVSPGARAVQERFPCPVSSVLCAVVGYGCCFFMYTLCAPRPRLPMPDVSSSRQRRSSLAAVLRSKPVSWQ